MYSTCLNIWHKHTSVLSGNVRPDKSQCPLHTLFLSVLLCYRGHGKVGEEEGKLPAGLVAVLTTVHCIEWCLCAVLCPQAAGSQGGKRRGEQMVALLVLKQNVWVCLMEQARMCCSFAFSDFGLRLFHVVASYNAGMNICTVNKSLF